MEEPRTYKVRERLIPESQLRDVIKEILAEMLGVGLLAQRQQRQWYDTDPAFRYLNLGSADHLRDMVRNGILRIGHEVRDVRSPSSQTARYQFHIEKCEARLSLPPEQRQPKKSKKIA